MGSNLNPATPLNVTRKNRMAGRRQPVGPCYDEEEYWEEKFKVTPDAFEWLGSGEILLEAFRHYQRQKANDDGSEATQTKGRSPLPRVLQLGVGTSNLSLSLAKEFYIGDRSSLRSIINVDFSQEALSIGENQASKEDVVGMQFIRLDFRNWKELSSCSALNEEGYIDFIFDKSTSDAISTNPDVVLASLSDEDECQLLKTTRFLNETNGDDKPAAIDPLDLVALHLAALSKAGCLWAVLSYSDTRFQMFNDPACYSRRYWSVLQKKPIQAPSGSVNVNAPPVFHWFYLLQRCGASTGSGSVA
ncbi:hypothetical protein CBS101457_006120 [Exobasidium rhododendri]|nr:hypothetical protein CBS101457_006120 [Exobasidium rhododendri]